MNVLEPVRVVLELERQASTISGTVAVDGAPKRGFFGWLELIDKLERAAARAPDPTLKPSRASTPSRRDPAPGGSAQPAQTIATPRRIEPLAPTLDKEETR